jgi:hypothetical protein
MYAEKLMDRLQARYGIHTDMHIKIESFSSFEVMRKKLLDDLNQTITQRECPNPKHIGALRLIKSPCSQFFYFTGGVHFSDVTLGVTPKLVYRILLPKLK